MDQRSPQEPGELAGNCSDDVLLRLAACGEGSIAPGVIGVALPRDVDGGRRSAALPMLQRGTKKGVVPVLPSGLDEAASVA